MSAAAPPAADDTEQAVFDPATINVTGLPGDTLGRTSVLRPASDEPLEDVEIMAQDLVADDTALGAGVAIQSGKVSVVPSTISSTSEPVTLSVTVSTDTAQRAGTYKGDIVVLSGGVETLRLPFEVNLVNAAMLEFDAAAITMQATKAGWLLGGGGKGAVSLNNNGLGTAANLVVTAGAFQSDSGSLSADAVTATADNAAPPGEVTIGVTIDGDGTAPGKYDGSVSATADGIARITKLVTINVKEGSEIAIVTLMFGILLGWLFIAWSSKYGPRLSQADAIIGLSERVAGLSSRLMRIDRIRAQQAVEHAALLYNTEGSASEITAAMERATKLLTDAQTNYEEGRARLGALFEDTDDKNSPGFKVLAARRDALEERIEKCEFVNWDEALAEIATLKSDVETWRETGSVPAPAAASPDEETAVKPVDQIYSRRWLLVSLRTVVTILAFIVLVFVGYVSLYANNATFGASAEDYVALVLFGSVVEGLWGKNVKLSDLKVTYTP